MHLYIMLSPADILHSKARPYDGSRAFNVGHLVMLGNEVSIAYSTLAHFGVLVVCFQVLFLTFVVEIESLVSIVGCSIRVRPSP